MHTVWKTSKTYIIKLCKHYKMYDEFFKNYIEYINIELHSPAIEGLIRRNAKGGESRG